MIPEKYDDLNRSRYLFEFEVHVEDLTKQECHDVNISYRTVSQDAVDGFEISSK